MAEEDEPERMADARGAKGVQIGDGNVQINAHAAGHPAARSAYRHQVRAIVPELLVGREAELADLEAFCTGTDSADYLWLRAGPWAGKTALMSWFVLNPPPAVCIVSFFVTARLAAQSDRNAFLDVVIEQLATVLAEPVPAFLTEATRAAHLWAMLEAAAVSCADRGQRLILVVDGLDEDAGAGLHSIAALLPASPVAGMRVIVTGRHDPPVPPDVPARHPLRDPAVERTLAASATPRTNPDAHQEPLVQSLASLGLAQREAGHTERAVTTLTESITISRQLADTNPDPNQRWLAEVLLIRSRFAAKAEGAETARKWAKEALHHFVAVAHRDPSAEYQTRVAVARRWLSTLAPPRDPDLRTEL